jgi:subtilase family serine protease
MSVPGITLHFRPTAHQSAELDQLLADQQDPSSPRYHAWLTPEEFGRRFGLSANDFARVRDWIESQGFRIQRAAQSRTWITFSGTAGQVRSTFETDLHRLREQGRTGFANVMDVSLPVDLAPMVSAISGLDGFRTAGGPRRRALETSLGKALAPADLATIYNLNPIYARGITGAGQKIVVIGSSAFQLSDVQSFRKEFGLPKNDPQVILVPGSQDPGVGDELLEALADVQWAGASAPEATILYVYSEWHFESVLYAIDRNLAPVITDSYGGCEDGSFAESGIATAVRAAAQQANAQGITWVGVTGDSGPSGCEPHQVAPVGLSFGVWAPASIPEVTAVGGTALNEGTGDYWDSKNAARSYIPEAGWNETHQGLAASGGGASKFYSRPVWQAGPGVPNDNARHVPDIAFAAAWDHNPYLIVSNGKLALFGGTSVAGPFFAGTLALLNQYVVTSGAQAKPGLGNINPRLYQLARIAPQVFHDITEGDNIIPCDARAPGCTNGKWGFQAGPGYDQVTGLGSIDFKNLFDNWSRTSSSQIPTSLTLTVTPTEVSADGSVSMTATVKAATGTSTPTGSVAVRVGIHYLGSVDLAGTGSNAIAKTTITGLSQGDNAITAVYGGTADFAPSTSTVTVTVRAPGAVVVASVDPSPVYRQKPDADGNQWFYTIRLTETGGAPATITSLSLDGFDLSGYIQAMFGSKTLPAKGTLSRALSDKNVPVPSDHVFAFGGMDDAKQPWSQKITVAFRGDRPPAAMSLTSTPSIVARGDSRCTAESPYYQALTLRELNGSNVTLTKFLIGPYDASDRIAAWFGSQRLPALGALNATLCSAHAEFR